MLPRPPNINYIIYIPSYFFFKEEPHTNTKDLPKQLAKLNVCIDNSLYVIMSNKGSLLPSAFTQ